MCCCFSVVDVWPCIQTDSGILNVWCKLVIDVMLELVYVWCKLVIDVMLELVYSHG